ncbi:metalloregulator ArsR/SmtB family transcription factor [uncultured Hoeflea sp.]|uniref:ArsR/SmtB family transcription factor n=1 Tax=uncultured Hoeflea sp. TaxID=538666 RepID=UPI002602CA35|nr:metalloregulator ArsR/SmtB family transcription factor [uncultured Hoeflea sp.]
MPELSTIFAALGDPTRFAIVERLIRDGEQPAGELLDAGPVSAPAISRHLKVLRKAGIVTQRVDRQRRIYAVRPEAVQSIGAWTMSHREFWQGSLDRLELALQQESERK